MAAFLLDTDTSVDLFNGTALAADWMLGQRVSISVITAYELAVGTEKCRSAKSRSETIGFLEAIEILEFDDLAARESAQVRTELEAERFRCSPALECHGVDVVVLEALDLVEFENPAGRTECCDVVCDVGLEEE